MTDYMLDTSTVGQIEDRDIPVELLSGSANQFYITHVQKDELTEAGGYAENLLEVVEIVAATEVTTESMIWGISKYGASPGFEMIFPRTANSETCLGHLIVSSCGSDPPAGCG